MVYLGSALVVLGNYWQRLVVRFPQRLTLSVNLSEPAKLFILIVASSLLDQLFPDLLVDYLFAVYYITRKWVDRQIVELLGTYISDRLIDLS